MRFSLFEILLALQQLLANKHLNNLSEEKITPLLYTFLINNYKNFSETDEKSLNFVISYMLTNAQKIASVKFFFFISNESYLLFPKKKQFGYYFMDQRNSSVTNPLHIKNQKKILIFQFRFYVSSEKL